MSTIFERLDALEAQMNGLNTDYNHLSGQLVSVEETVEEVLNSINGFLPDQAEDINDKDLNECVGKIIFGYGNGCLNKPTGSNGYLINIPHHSSPTQFNKQIWITRPTNNVYIRNMDNGTFTAWLPVRHDTGWSALTLASGVSEQNTSQYPCRYRKINSQVFIDGCVKGLTATGQIVCTLPEGYRPSKSYYFQSATNAGKTDTFRVHTDGRIEYMSTTGTVAASNYHFITTSFLTD